MAKRATKVVEKPEPTSSGWPGAEIIALDYIKPYLKNARTHPPEQVALLAKLLKRHGADQPIVVDEEGVILKGHGRRLAAIEAGFIDFPVVTRHGLPDSEKQAIRLADNQSALLSGWDRELLAAEIKDLRLAQYDIPLLGFGADFLDSLKLTGFLGDLIEPGGLGSSSAVAAGGRGVMLRFDLMPSDRDMVVAWLASERDRRSLRTTAEALVALAHELKK